ncbi:hypothetical protein ABPG72_014058 [Tetrahymena utriculariae]
MKIKQTPSLVLIQVKICLNQRQNLKMQNVQKTKKLLKYKALLSYSLKISYIMLKNQQIMMLFQKIGIITKIVVLFLFDDYNPELFLFQADIQSLQITKVKFTGKIVFPIVNPLSEINFSDLTLDNVKFMNSTLSSNLAVPLSNLEAKIQVKVSNLNIVSTLFDGSNLFQYQNDFLNLILNTINIDQTKKFANRKSISLILTRKLQVLNINLGCRECEDEQLDFNWYRFIQIPDLQKVQKQQQAQTPSIFSVQNLLINQSIFRQKSLLINIPFIPLKVSHLTHTVTLKTIIFTCKIIRIIYLMQGNQLFRWAKCYLSQRSSRSNNKQCSNVGQHQFSDSILEKYFLQILKNNFQKI